MLNKDDRTFAFKEIVGGVCNLKKIELYAYSQVLLNLIAVKFQLVFFYRKYIEKNS